MEKYRAVACFRRGVADYEAGRIKPTSFADAAALARFMDRLRDYIAEPPDDETLEDMVLMLGWIRSASGR
ncbi:MAG TPA: hypothetical protein VMR23_01905 [Candidatus Limnocylindria bacterium]|nr:hypothetical protein [Candidatus Limnocylindria bacterium]